MSHTRIKSTRGIVCAGLLAMMGLTTGCQATMNGQTLPSPTYLRDDIQYFPAGPEFLLPNQVRALEEYKAQQAEFTDEFDAVVP